MRHTISDDKLNELLSETHNPMEPTRSRELLRLLKGWLDDPWLDLSERQRSSIEDVLRHHGIL